MTPERAVAIRCCGPFLFPFFHLFTSPFQTISWGSFEVKVPKILPRSAPENLPWRGDSSSKNPVFSPSIPWKLPRLHAWPGRNYHLKSNEFKQKTNISPKISLYISPERADSWEDVQGVDWGFACEGYPWKSRWRGRCGGFDWEFLLRRMPPEREKITGLVRGNDWGNVREKLQKLSFLRFEMVRKSVIFQQTNGQKS